MAEPERSTSEQSGMARRGEKVIGSTESCFNGSIVEPSKQHVLSAGERVIVKFRSN